jgi:hypothetical protein
LNRADHLKSPLVWQTIVHYRDLKALPGSHLPRLGASAGRDHTPPLLRKRPPKVQPLFNIPYHQQNGHTHGTENHSILVLLPKP